MNPDLSHALSEIASWPVRGDLDAAPIKIHGGLTNRSYLLKINQSAYRLRLNSPVTESLGIDRKRESNIVQHVHNAGLGPALLFSGEKYRYSLFEYVEGRPWSTEDFHNQKQRARLDDCIRAFQRLSIGGSPRNYRTYLNQYWQQLRNTDQLSASERQKYLAFDAFLGQQTDQGSDYVLCHHDLIPENIIEAENGLSIIDWEYAALGHPELDSYCLENYRADMETRTFQNDDTIGQLVFWLNRLWALVSEKLWQPDRPAYFLQT